MRLIDADALKYRRKDYGGHDDVSDEERKCGILFLLKEDIAAAPTIDAVTVVRCKDCKWYRKEYGWNCIEYKVCGISPTHHPIMNEDEFCSRAERNEND